ncbi:uncharacterized protein LOC135210901 [Macrobrachium nipponense]|uniref:uncharacterized protein LOC135210901 n=1 Tax=Macrobrachium nipponense TaxID=159736 RepID=UPI0030C83281
MVAPHEVGDLVRSLVRIPGSGHDRTMPSSCLDLAKVSVVAASVPISTTIPPAIARPLAQRETNRRGAKDREGPVASRTEKRGNASGGENVEHPPMKKPCHVVVNGRHPQLVMGTSAVVIGTPVQLMFHSGQQIQPQAPVQIGASAGSSTPSVSQLLQEVSSLQAENVSLNERLSLFHQLFKDKKRLASVLLRLGIKPQC